MTIMRGESPEVCMNWRAIRDVDDCLYLSVPIYSLWLTRTRAGILVGVSVLHQRPRK